MSIATAGGSWEFVVALPGIDLPDPIDGRDLALVGADDSRYVAIRQADVHVDRFLGAFRTALGQSIRPSIIVRQANLPLIDAGELTGFRNAIAAAMVIESKARSHQARGTVGIPFSDLLDLYPMYPGRGDSSSIYVRTPVELGLHKTQAFSGQPSPVAAYPEQLRPTHDTPLLDGCLALWNFRGGSRETRTFRRRVFRVLDLTNHALRAPFKNQGNQIDYGVSIALWVSAFETLAHPGDENVTFSHVADMIRRVPWHNARLRRASYRPATSKPRASGRRWPNTTRPVQIYGRLYRARNHLLHGNPLPRNGVEPFKRKDWGPLLMQVPVLFRSVLLHQLMCAGFGRFPRNVLPYDDPAFAESLMEHMEHDRDYERPLYAP